MGDSEQGIRERVGDPRQLLLEAYRAGLDAVDGRASVVRALEAWAPHRAVDLLAIGKAASAMTRGALDVLGGGVRRGLVVTKYGHGDPALLGHPRRLRCIEAAHPVPDDASLRAGDAVLAFLEEAPADVPLLGLLSGGASSLFERLPPGVSADSLARMNRWLLGSGMPIHQMNRVRKAVSCVKGGRLASHLHGREARVLAISDVPGDAIASIGSGPLAPTPALDTGDLDLPEWVADLARAAPALPPSSAFEGIRHQVIASNAIARDAAAASVRAKGLTAIVHGELVQGEAMEVGESLATNYSDQAGIHVWGGEATVHLPPVPGRGGRCQSLALAAAVPLAARPGHCLLAAGTDGTDGPGEDAGALADDGTVRRGEDAGLSVRDCLARADAGTFLEASGDLIHTGPTGTNVMDLMMLWVPG